MNSPLYLVVQIGFAILTLLFFGLFLKELKPAMSLAGYDAATQNRYHKNTLAALIFWFVLVSALSLTGFLEDFSTIPPRMMIILVPPLALVIWLSTRKRVRQIIRNMPSQKIVRLQVFRVFVEILLWLLFLINLLPEQMTFEGRNFDVLAGLTAPLVAYFCLGNRPRKTIAIIWNLAALGLLINIVTIALLSFPTPFRYFMNEPANTVVTHWPIILLPAFLVPLAYTLHTFSLIQLLRKHE